MNGNKKINIGFIGTGKMSSAIIKGLVKSENIINNNIMSTKSNSENLDILSNELGIKIILDNKKLCDFADIIFIATKPNQVSSVLEEIKEKINNSKLIVSIAAGVSLNTIENILPEKTRVIRVMPNTPALVGEGMSGIVSGKFATLDDIKLVQNILNTIGKTVIVDSESELDIVTAISGSGPAFFYKVINDIARAGEKLGLDYDKALLLSIQTALGSAKMSLNRTISMEELISNVATKGGCTRVGIDCMEERQSNNLFYDVIKKTTEKAHALGK